MIEIRTINIGGKGGDVISNDRLHEFNSRKSQEKQLQAATGSKRI